MDVTRPGAAQLQLPGGLCVFGPGRTLWEMHMCLLYHFLLWRLCVCVCVESGVRVVGTLRGIVGGGCRESSKTPAMRASPSSPLPSPPSHATGQPSTSTRKRRLVSPSPTRGEGDAESSPVPWRGGDKGGPGSPSPDRPTGPKMDADQLERKRLTLPFLDKLEYIRLQLSLRGVGEQLPAALAATLGREGMASALDGSPEWLPSRKGSGPVGTGAGAGLATGTVWDGDATGDPVTPVRKMSGSLLFAHVAPPGSAAGAPSSGRLLLETVSDFEGTMSGRAGTPVRDASPGPGGLMTMGLGA